RDIHRVQVFDFGRLPDLIAEGLSARMPMEHRDAQGFGEVVLDLDTPGALQYQLGRIESARRIPDKGDLRDYWIRISYAGDFLGTAPSYTFIWDPMLRLCHRLIACSIARRSQAPKKVTMTDLFYLRGMDVGSVNVPYLLARYLRLFASGRKQEAMISEGQYVARLAEHFRFLTEERLQGLTVISHEGGAGGVVEEASVAPGGGDEDEREVLDSMAHDFFRFSTLTVTSLARLMDRVGVPYTRYSKSLVEYQRCTRQRTDEPNTFAAPSQPDP
nr:hypothetical protein [Tanacetum cinerariifolium]